MSRLASLLVALILVAFPELGIGKSEAFNSMFLSIGLTAQVTEIRKSLIPEYVFVVNSSVNEKNILPRWEVLPINDIKLQYTATSQPLPVRWLAFNGKIFSRESISFDAFERMASSPAAIITGRYSHSYQTVRRQSGGPPLVSSVYGEFQCGVDISLATINRPLVPERCVYNGYMRSISHYEGVGGFASFPKGDIDKTDGDSGKYGNKHGGARHNSLLLEVVRRDIVRFDFGFASGTILMFFFVGFVYRRLLDGDRGTRFINVILFYVVCGGIFWCGYLLGSNILAGWWLA